MRSYPIPCGLHILVMQSQWCSKSRTHQANAGSFPIFLATAYSTTSRDLLPSSPSTEPYPWCHPPKGPRVSNPYHQTCWYDAVHDRSGSICRPLSVPIHLFLWPMISCMQDGKIPVLIVHLLEKTESVQSHLRDVLESTSLKLNL